MIPKRRLKREKKVARILAETLRMTAKKRPKRERKVVKKATAVGVLSHRRA